MSSVGTSPSCCAVLLKTVAPSRSSVAVCAAGAGPDRGVRAAQAALCWRGWAVLEAEAASAPQALLWRCWFDSLHTLLEAL